MRIRLDFATLRAAAIVAAGGLVAFHAVREHSVEMGLVDTLQQVGLGSLATFLTPKAPYGAPLPQAAQLVNQTGSEPAGPQCYGSGNEDSMRAANPDIDSLLQFWINQGGWRKVGGLGYTATRYDWGAFRALTLREGYPDPGNSPPPVFCM